MAEGKKIVFEGVSSGLVKAAEDSKKSLVNLHESNTKGLKDTNNLLKEQNSLLEAQKRLITSIASEGLSGPQTSVVSQLTNRLFQSEERVNPEHLKSYAKILESQLHIGQAGSMSEKLIQKVQELIDTQKIQHRETSTHHQKDDEEKRNINKGALVFLSKEVEKTKRLEKIEKQNEKSSKLFGTKDGQIVSEEGHARQFDIPLSFEGMLESMTHKLATLIGAGAIGGILGKVVDMTWGIIEKRHAINAAATTGIETSFQESELIGANAYLKDIAGKRRSRSELTSFQEGAFKSYATSGRNFDRSYADIAAELGISESETASMLSGSSRSRGRLSTAAEMYGSQFSNRVLGIDQSNISSLENQSRFGGGSNVKNIIEQIITSLGLEKDRSKANELTQLLVSLGQQQLHTLGKIDQQGNLATIKAFQSTGGALFQNAETLSPIISNFNQALANPKGDFQRAERFATLSKLNPGKSYPQLMREMQRGKDSPGVIKETLSRISKRGGGIDGMVMELVSSGLASNYEEAFELAEGYMKNDAIFDNLSGAGITGKNTSSQIGSVVDRFDKVSKAKIQNAFLKSPEAGYAMVEEEVGKFDSSNKSPEIEKRKLSVAELFAATDNASDAMKKNAIETKMATLDLKEFAKATKESTKAFNQLLKDLNNNGIRSK